jgi:hypothetical protein
MPESEEIYFIQLPPIWRGDANAGKTRGKRGEGKM